MKRKFALFLAIVLVVAQMGNYVVANAAGGREVLGPSELKGDVQTAATVEETTFQGVDALKITPDSNSNETIWFDNWDIRNVDISSKDYKYLAIDYYYEVKDVARTENVLKLSGDGSWQDNFQEITGFEVGTTYVFTCDYYMPEGAEGSIRFKRGWSQSDVEQYLQGRGTASLEYTVEPGFDWFGINIVQVPKGDANMAGYYWNFRVTKKGSDENLLKNTEFTEGEQGKAYWGLNYSTPITYDDFLSETGYLADDMVVRLLPVVNSNDYRKSDNKMITNQWARLIYDVSDWGTDFSGANFDQMHFFPWGQDGHCTGSTAVGTMYINNMSFYEENPGMPEVTDIYFESDSLNVKRGDSISIPNVTVEGENLPISNYDLELSEHTSTDTKIQDGNLYIGEDEAVSEITITVKSVVNTEKQDTCIVKIRNASLIPSGEPEYMAKLVGTYVDSSGATQQWKELSQNIFVTEGTTYEFSFNYFVPNEGHLEGRIMNRDWGIIESVDSVTGEIGTVKITYTANAEDEWVTPLISKDTEGYAYIWNLCFKEVDGTVNLLRNGDFSNEDGSWIDWNIGGITPSDKAGSDELIVAFGHKIVKYDETQFKNVLYEYVSDISKYRGTKKTYPVREGYVFAGWWQGQKSDEIVDDTELEPVAKETTGGGAWAKYVPEEVLSVKAQTTNKITDNPASTKLRLVTTVDSLRYGEVGFKIKYNQGNKEYTHDTREVYKAINVLDENDIPFKYAPSEFARTSDYFAAYTITGIDAALFNKYEFAVTPYWITLDGTTVGGVRRERLLVSDQLACNADGRDFKVSGSAYMYMSKKSDDNTVSHQYVKGASDAIYMEGTYTKADENHQFGLSIRNGGEERQIFFAEDGVNIVNKSMDASGLVDDSAIKITDKEAINKMILAESKTKTKVVWKIRDNVLYCNLGEVTVYEIPMNALCADWKDGRCYQLGIAGYNSDATTRAIFVLEQFEKGYMIDDYLNEVEAKAEARKQEILSTEDEITISGQRYYVSNEGNDSANGKTPETAWKTLDKVSNASLNSGDGVFFRRGDTFRGKLYTKAGVTYAAYGQGKKPNIYGNDENLASSQYWTLFDAGNNIWKCTKSIPDVGTLVFNDGEQWSRKLTPSYYNSQFVCRENPTKTFQMEEEMTQDLDLYWKHSGKLESRTIDGNTYRLPKVSSSVNGQLYLRCDSGNPGEYFRSIEVLRTRNIIQVDNDANIHIDNLCIKYGGAHGVAANGDVVGLRVTNCEIGWIGGGVHNYDGNILGSSEYGPGQPTRYGNGVEIYGGCENFEVSNCYFYQIYDAAMTHQMNASASAVTMENVQYKNNLVENCTYSIEYFLNQNNDNTSYMNGVEISGNILRLAGYGWGQQRTDVENAAHIKGWYHNNAARDFVIHGNILDRSTRIMLELTAIDEESLPQMYNNTYVQELGGTVGKYGTYSGMAGYVIPFDRNAEARIWKQLGDLGAIVRIIPSEK